MATLRRPGGVRLTYEVAGDPRRAPLVLLGGIGGAIATWRRNVPRLASELFVVALDHRGIGGSGDDPAGSTSMRTYADDVVAILDELRLGRAHLYGHSFGATVALEVALEHEERTRALVLGAARPGDDRAVRVRTRVAKDRPWHQLYSASFVASHPEHVEQDRIAVRRRPGGERLQLESLRSWAGFGRLGSISAPTLVLHGTQDRLIDPRNAELLAGAIPGAELVRIEGAGHAYHSERPESDEIVLDFLRRHRGR